MQESIYSAIADTQSINEALRSDRDALRTEEGTLIASCTNLFEGLQATNHRVSLEKDAAQKTRCAVSESKNLEDQSYGTVEQCLMQMAEAQVCMCEVM